MSADPPLLRGYRVLDLTRYIPGPYCTLLLADLGADVVKVEEPGVGDPTRVVPPAVGDTGVVYAALNRNKRSIVVDIRQEQGAAVVRRLAADSDVFVEGYRPGVLARRGLGSDRLLAENPRLVYCSLTGYGQDGPLAARAGHDIDYLALGGFLGANPAPLTTQVADMTGGLLATLGILAALLAREQTGRGRVVDISMLEGVLALMTVPAARVMAGGPLANELTGTHACYNVFSCRDGGHLAVGALEPKFWEALCGALGVPERAKRQWESGEKRRETLETVGSILSGRDRDDWARALAPADACVEPVLDLAEALAHPQVAARGAVVEERSGESTFRTVASPLRPGRRARPVPGLGEHTAEVLAEAAFSEEEIARMRESGAVA